jgi:hypothetical protein
MRAFGFIDRNLEPSGLYSSIKETLQNQGFKVTSEEIQDGHWDLHARKTGLARIILGSARDVDILLSGDRNKFGVQLRTSIWGRDFAIPGEHMFSSGDGSRSVSGFEEGLWEEIVHMVDPSLRVCPVDGQVFSSEKELDDHVGEHEKNQQAQMNYFAMSQNWGWI